MQRNDKHFNYRWSRVIGSHVIKLFVKDKSYNVFNLDSLTYAGSLNNIEGLEKEENYTFIKGDICDKKVVSLSLIHI